MIFRFFFVFIDKSFVEKKSIDNTILSESFKNQNDDVFCAYNSGRLYQIFEDSPKTFQIQDQLIEDEVHKNIIQTLLLKINDNESEYQQEICSKLKQQNNIDLDGKITFFIKILNLNIKKITFYKLELNMQLHLYQLTLNEIESAQIIFSHFFSIINNRDVFLCKMMRLMAKENFHFEKFEYELFNLEKNFDYGNSFLKVHSITENDYIQRIKEMNTNNINVDSHYKVDFLSISFRNFINFFHLFFEKFHIVVVDDNLQTKILKFFVFRNAPVPFIMHYKHFLKIASNFCLPNHIVYVYKNNFTILNLFLETVFFKSYIKKVILDITNFVECDSDDNIIEIVNNFKNVSTFFKKLCESSNAVVKFVDLYFTFNQAQHNFVLEKFSNYVLENLSLNNLQFLSCVDLYTNKHYLKLPNKFRLFIEEFMRIIMKKKNIYESFMNIYSIQKNTDLLNKTKHKIKKTIGIKIKQKTLKMLILNRYLIQFASKNIISEKNFFFCTHVKYLHIHNFTCNSFLVKNIFFAGKFDNIMIRTNKKIDVCVDIHYATFHIHNDDFEKDSLYTNIFKQIHFLHDYSVINYKKICLTDKNFNIIFFNFAKAISNRNISTFFYEKDVNSEQILSIYDCSIIFSSRIPDFINEIKIINSEIKLVDNKTDYLCFKPDFRRLNIKKSSFECNPMFNIKKCNFYGYQNYGDFALTFDDKSTIDIFEHSGKILLNNILQVEFESENSSFHYNLSNIPTINIFGCPIYTTKKIFRRVIFLNDITFTLERAKIQRLIQCRFQQGCRLYLFHAKNEKTEDLFKTEGHEHNYYESIIDLTIVDMTYFIKIYT